MASPSASPPLGLPVAGSGRFVPWLSGMTCNVKSALLKNRRPQKQFPNCSLTLRREFVGARFTEFRQFERLPHLDEGSEAATRLDAPPIPRCLLASRSEGLDSGGRGARDVGVEDREVVALALLLVVQLALCDRLQRLHDLLGEPPQNVRDAAPATTVTTAATLFDRLLCGDLQGGFVSCSGRNGTSGRRRPSAPRRSE